MTIGQGDLSSGDKQTHGAAIRNTTIVSKEETECEDRKYKNKKTAKIMSYYKK